MGILDMVKGLFTETDAKDTTHSDPSKLQQFQRQIGYQFRDETLLEHAFKHRSWQNRGKERGNGDTNERLEFLGDAVLSIVVAEHLFKSFPRKREGELTRYKSLVVNGKYLMKCARKIGLGDVILMSNAEEKTGGRRRLSILEDAFEALIGAVYLDGGLEPARSFIHSHVIEGVNFQQLDNQNRNHKSSLLEFTQGLGLGSPVYKVKDESGPDHNKRFLVAVTLKKLELAEGTGASKKSAEQMAAREAMKKLRSSNSSLLNQLKGA